MKNDLEDFIQRNREGFDRKAPDPAVFGRIMAQMQPKEEPKEKGIIIPFRVIRWAAAGLILFAIGFTFWTLQKRPETVATVVKPKVVSQPQVENPDKQIAAAAPVKTETLKRKSADSVEKELTTRKQAIFTKLKEQKSNPAKEVIFAGLNNMDSPASRINAASEAYKLRDAGNDIVDALVETLNNDPSANVRLAALDGLTRFYRNGHVRKKLIASLKKQQDPLVQIALINLLTQMRESSILAELDKIVNDDNAQKAVKDCAYSGIIQLHSL